MCLCNLLYLIACYIFISCLDTSPLSVDPEIFIEQNLDDFNKGIEIISLITSKYVHISSKIGSNLFVESEKVRLYELNNLHPAGNVGTQIHYISPLGRNKSVWTINYQHVCHIGHMFNFGRLSFKKLVSVAGPQVKAPFLLETISGVDLIEVLKDHLFPCFYQSCASCLTVALIYTLFSEGFQGCTCNFSSYYGSHDW